MGGCTGRYQVVGGSCAVANALCIAALSAAMARALELSMLAIASAPVKWTPTTVPPIFVHHSPISLVIFSFGLLVGWPISTSPADVVDSLTVSGHRESELQHLALLDVLHRDEPCLCWPELAAKMLESDCRPVLFVVVFRLNRFQEPVPEVRPDEVHLIEPAPVAPVVRAVPVRNDHSLAADP
jgi:hypothetical protein